METVVVGSQRGHLRRGRGTSTGKLVCGSSQQRSPASRAEKWERSRKTTHWALWRLYCPSRPRRRRSLIFVGRKFRRQGRCGFLCRGVGCCGLLVFLRLLFLFDQELGTVSEQRINRPVGNEINPLFKALLLGQLFFQLLLLLLEFLVEPGFVLGLFVLARGALLGDLGSHSDQHREIVVGLLPNFECVGKVVEGIERNDGRLVEAGLLRLRVGGQDVSKARRTKRIRKAGGLGGVEFFLGFGLGQLPVTGGFGVASDLACVRGRRIHYSNRANPFHLEEVLVQPRVRLGFQVAEGIRHHR